MEQKSNEIVKKFRIELIKRDLTQAELAEQLGVRSTAITMALLRKSTRGKVYEWIKSNLGIDLKQTA
jgi:transcriptional regulator with XRE-family HTH domain